MNNLNEVINKLIEDMNNYKNLDDIQRIELSNELMERILKCKTIVNNHLETLDKDIIYQNNNEEEPLDYYLNKIKFIKERYETEDLTIDEQFKLYQNLIEYISHCNKKLEDYNNNKLKITYI